MITGSSTTWCQVSDMDRAVEFYRDALGLKPGHISPYWTDFELGSGRIGLHPKLEGSEEPLGTPGKGWYLGMTTSDLLATRNAIENSKGTVIGGFHDTPSGAVLTVADPDGNPIQIMQLGVTSAELG